MRHLDLEITETREGASRRSGFTLVELLIVIAIIVLLAGAIIGLLINGKLRAENRRAQATMTILESALDRYKELFSGYPKIDESLPEPQRNNKLLQELLKKKTYTTRDGLQRDEGSALEDIGDLAEFIGDSDGDWDRTQPMFDSQGRLIEGVEVLDPWGQPFLYRYPGEKHDQFPGARDNSSSYDLYSVGRNGEAEPEAVSIDETDDHTNWFRREEADR